MKRCSVGMTSDVSFELYGDEVRFFVGAFNDGVTPDYQLSARKVLGTVIRVSTKYLMCSPNCVWKVYLSFASQVSRGAVRHLRKGEINMTNVMEQFYGSITKHLTESEHLDDTVWSVTNHIDHEAALYSSNYKIHFRKLFRRTEENTFVVTRCFVCNKKCTMICSGCCTMKYCSSDCQAVDWKYHKVLCKHMRNHMRNHISQICNSAGDDI